MTSLITRASLNRLIGCVALVACCLLSVAAQDDLTPPKAEVRGTLGVSTFGDDGIPHAVVGGSVRFYLTERLSVEPEVLYMHHSANDKDIVVQPNLAFDLTKPTGRFVPYLIGGAGLLNHRGRFTTVDFTGPVPSTVTINTSKTTWTASAGAGLKIFITDRVFVAPEARIGREPVLRGTFSIGYVFSGRE